MPTMVGIALALAAHGVLDAVQGQVVVNAGEPPCWPAFYLTLDVRAAAVLAWLVRGSRATVRPGGRTTEAA